MAYRFLALSASSSEELATRRAEIVERLRCSAGEPPPSGEDEAGPWRWFSVYDSKEALTAALESAEGARCVPHESTRVAFLFPGHGADGDGIGAELYDSLPRFRRHFDACAGELRAEVDLVQALREPRPQTAPLVLFGLEYALASTWLEWGVEPSAMIGHSLGEYAAAAIAGVFTYRDALAVILRRSRLFESLGPGTMMLVPLAEERLELADPRLSVAAVNTARQTIVSGPIDAIEAFEAQLRARGVDAVRLDVPRAGHSSMVEPMIAPLVEAVRAAKLSVPQRRFVSNVTGDWALASEVTDPAYWGRQLRSTVRFADGLTRIFEDEDAVLLEVGPGRTLSAYARQSPGGRKRPMLASMRHGRGTRSSELRFLYETLGELWRLGVPIDWKAVEDLPRPAERELALPATTSAVRGEPTRAPALVSVDRQVRRRARQGRVTIPRRATDEARIPLSPSQLPIWFLQRLRPESLAYHFQARLRLRGQLDVAALRESLRAVVSRHEIFRTTFVEFEGEPRQVIHDDAVLDFEVEPLAHVDANELRRAIDRAMARECTKEFDLSRLPLIRWVLYPVHEEEHQLLQIEHHLVHDGWSSNLVFGEIIENYSAIVCGRAPRTEPPALEFADYALWHTRWCSSPAAAEQLEFWRTKMTPPPRPIALPFDRPRRPEQRFTGATIRVPLDESLYEDLKQLSRASNTTLYMAMLAGFMALLERYSGQEDLCIGCGAANRRSKELEEVVGMVINIIALRHSMRPDATFSELLAEVRETAVAAYAHQEIPFSAVVEAAQPERVAGRNPLFQVGFSFHETRLHRTAPGLEVDITLALPNGSSKFDMNVITVIDLSARAAGSSTCTLIWEYDSDLFEESTVRDMSRRYLALLALAVREPSRRTGAVSLDELLPSADERRFAKEPALLEPEVTEDEACVHELFSRHAARDPRAPALRQDGVMLSYGELERLANGLACRLVELGIGPESVVAVFAERSITMIVAELAVLKAGAAYLPIDPAHPDDRARAFLRDSEATVLLSSGALSPRARSLGVRVVDVDAANVEPPPGAEPRAPRARAHRKNLAYVIYTSGSTGIPKGALVRHAELTNLTTWYRQTYGIGPGDIASHVSGVGYDASVLEVWPALSSGACVSLPERMTAFHAESLARWLREESVTFCFLSTPLIGPLLRAGVQGSSLRVLLTGGEALHGIEGVALPVPVVDHYGPTECTVLTTCRPIAPDPNDPERRPSIGAAIRNAHVCVIDRRLRPQPCGAPGELALGGSVVGRGYLGSPALTAARFVPDPWSGLVGARHYLSGDAGRRLRNGEIEFLGRVDRQIKISGVRIEPGEIEAALRAHPEVADAVVIARPAPNGSLRLCAYYVSHGSGCTPSDLRRFVRRTLPRSMTPEVFVRLESFPLTANAKLDRERLPEPSEVPAQEPERSSLPETDLQQRVRAAWASVLSGSFGIDDNFFDVGGSSLRMVELQAIFREELGSEVPIARLFEYPTVRSFASWLEERGTPSGATGAPPPRELAERRRGLQQQAERQRLARERVRDE